MVKLGTIDEDARRIIEARRNAKLYGVQKKRPDGITEIDTYTLTQMELEIDLMDYRSAEEERKLMRRIRELTVD